MAYEKKDDTGALFKNDRKEKETHPDYKGDALIDGTEMWIAAWIKQGKNGKFMSLSFTPKDEQKAAAPAPSVMDMPDDIPF